MIIRSRLAIRQLNRRAARHVRREKAQRETKGEVSTAKGRKPESAAITPGSSRSSPDGAVPLHERTPIVARKVMRSGSDHNPPQICATIVLPRADDPIEDHYVATPSICLMSIPEQVADPATVPTDVTLRKRALDERRVLGAYYTPERLSQLLSDWAIRSPDDTVLEPSFGGCGFLSTARDTLARAGCVNPVAQIYGCDVDPVAFEYLGNVFGGEADTSGFILQDFLDCEDIAVWPAKFSVVLANPPYIPHHRIGKARVRELWRRTQGIAGVKGRASLWAYFLSHAVSLLRPGGRMAWVLPGAFLQADYAAPIRTYLGQHFERCAAFIIHERLFLTEGADEETVILLADGHRAEPTGGTIEVGEAKTLAALEALIAQWVGATWVGRTGSFSPATLSLTAETQRLIASLSEQGNALAFGEVAKVQIGLVTGNNKFFVLDRAECIEAGLATDDYVRILSKFKAATGVNLTPDDLDIYDGAGGRSFLIASDGKTDSAALQAYLATYPVLDRTNVSTFRKRGIWSQVPDGKTPDAFFPVMHHAGPRLVLNPNRLHCTNTIHRVFFTQEPSEAERQLYALAMLTTFSQISAELCGRRYGSGVLKHEPRDAERIQMILPNNRDPENLSEIHRQVDAALRGGEPELARRIADAAIWGWAGLKIPPSDAALLEHALIAMRQRRRPDRQLSSNSRSTSEQAQLSR